MHTYNFIFILFIPNFTQCLTSINIVSDLVDPFEYCNEKKECEQIGIDGEVECIKKCCSCVNNTKYQKQLRGCFKNIGFGDVCNVTPECTTPGSICGYTNCEKNLHKRCVCKGSAELIHGSCIANKDKIVRKCCKNADCNFENMYCNTDTQKCECIRNFYFFNNSCVSHIDINICKEDDDCDHLANSKCSKVKNTLISKCECKPDFYFFNNTCFPHNTCSNNKKCRNNENCYLLSESEYGISGICYKGLICKNKEININNQCISIEEKFCMNSTDCNDREICYSISKNNVGICIQEPKNKTHPNNEKNRNLPVFNKTNKTNIFKAEVLTYGINNAGNIKKNQTFVFLYLIISLILFSNLK